MKISTRLSSVLKVATVATGVFMLTPHSSAVEYVTEGMVKVRMVSDLGEKADLPKGEDPETYDRTPKWHVNAVTALVGSVTYDGTWLDINDNGKFDPGEQIWPSANFVSKVMNPKVREVSMYVKPEVRMFGVVASGLTSIDVSGCKNITTLCLQRNHLYQLDISNNKNLKYIHLPMNRLKKVTVAQGHQYPLTFVDIARNQLGADAIYNLAKATWDRKKTAPEGAPLTPGRFFIGDRTEEEGNKPSKSSLSLLQEKNWSIILYESYDGVIGPDGEPQLGDDVAFGTEEFEEWAKEHVVEDPQDLSAEQLVVEAIKAYPSVTAASINVEVPAGLLGSTLFMYNMNGNLVYTEKLNGRTSIDVAGLPNGVYLIKVNNQVVRVQVAH